MACSCDKQPYTNFSFEYNGKSVEDPFTTLHDALELPEDGPSGQDVYTLSLVPQDYNEREMKLHIQRTRAALLFPEQNNFDGMLSLNSGLSTFDKVEKVVIREGTKAKDAAELQRQEEELKKKVSGEDEQTASKEKSEPTSSPAQSVSGGKKKKKSSNSRQYSPAVNGVENIEPDHEPLAGSKFATSSKPVAPPKKETVQPALNALCISAWGPPPPQLRLQGHIMYLYMETRQGKKVHITASKKGFFVNGSTADRFDPIPKLSEEYRTLYELVRKVATGFVNYWKKHSPVALHFANIRPSNSFLAVPWNVDAEAVQDNSPLMDQGRNQFTPKVENEWGEELQIAREIGQFEDNLADDTEESEADRTRRKTQDRILKDRMLNKALFDFCGSAAVGSVDVIRGVMAPMNADVNKEAEIFLDDGIFYSFGSDATGLFAKYGGDEAARVAAGKDLSGVNAVSKMDIPGLAVLGTAVVDYCGRRIVCQTPVPGVLGASTESITQIQYGMVDHDTSTIAASESFQPIMEKIGAICRLKKHQVSGVDGEGKESVVELATSVETRGLNGTDGRKYVLDLYKLTPPDLNFLTSLAPSDYPHKLCLMRYEAVDEWWRECVRQEEGAKKKQEEKPQEETGEGDSEAAQNEQRFVLTEEQVSFYTEKYSLNPDVLNDPAQVNSSITEQYTKDREEVLSASKFIQDTLIPRFVEDLASGTSSVPVSGQHLTKMLHARGINMRYLGYISKEFAKNPLLSVCVKICEHEAVIRATKHVINKMLRVTAVEDAPGLVVDIFNSIFGKAEKSAQVLSEILVQTRSRFNIEVESFNFTALSVFRDLSCALGLQWSLDETFDISTYFDTQKLRLSQLVNIVPKVKQSTYKSYIAEEEMRTAELNVTTDAKIATDLVTESLSLYEQIYNVVHPETAQAYSRASAIYRELGHNEIACELGRKGLLLTERTLGPDSSEFLLTGVNLALLEHAAGNTVGALYIYEHIMKYWNCVVPADHPDSAIAMTNIASMFFVLQKWEESCEWFERALALLDASSDEESTNRQILRANCRYQLAQTYIFQKMFKEALESMKSAHSIYLKHLGKDDASTKETYKWVEQLVQVLVSLSKNQKIVLQKPDENINLSTKGAMSEKSIDDLVAYINGSPSSTSKSSKKNKKKGRK